MTLNFTKAGPLNPLLGSKLGINDLTRQPKLCVSSNLIKLLIGIECLVHSSFNASNYWTAPCHSAKNKK